MSFQEITFKEKREHHFYAKRDSKGQLVLVQEPKEGDTVYEIAVVAGG